MTCKTSKKAIKVKTPPTQSVTVLIFIFIFSTKKIFCIFFLIFYTIGAFCDYLLKLIWLTGAGHHINELLAKIIAIKDLQEGSMRLMINRSVDDWCLKNEPFTVATGQEEYSQLIQVID